MNDDESKSGKTRPPQPPTFFPVIEEEAPVNRFSKVAVVVLLSDPDLSKEESTYRLNKDRIVIGSVESADVRLQGKGVSPIHAVIELSDLPEGSFSANFFDLASEAGTLHNGKKAISGQLKQNDKLTIGSHELKFFVEELEQASQAVSSVTNKAGQALFIDPEVNLKELVLQTADGVEEIFDYRGSHKGALEVVMSWYETILEIGHFNKQAVTVGSHNQSDFVIPPILSSNRFPIVNRMGDEFVINVDSRMLGVVQKDGKLQQISDLRRQQDVSKRHFQVALGPNDFAKISVGDIHFYISFTAAPPRLMKRRVVEKDPFFFRIFWGSMVFSLAFIMLLLRMEPPEVLDEEALPERIATIIYSPEKYSDFYRPPSSPEKNTPRTAPETKGGKVKIDLTKADMTKSSPAETIETRGQQGASQAQPKGGEEVGPARVDKGREGEGAKHKGASGQRGSKQSTAEANVDRATRPSTRGGQGRGGTRSQVNDLGNLEALKGAAGTIKDLLSGTTSKLGQSGERLKGIGGFEGQGFGGAAISGTGAGGGGTAESLGLSNKGKGGGRVGTGPGASGTGANIIGGKKRVSLNLGSPYDSVVLGAIDAAAVLAAIRRHADEFRLCYETELNAYQPNLAGRVGTNFVIGQRGKVTKAGIISTSLKNPRVERCVLRVLRRIQFPIPKGGGTVEVTIPFKFRVGGR